MQIKKLKNLSQKDYERIVNRSAGTYQSIMPDVRRIMNDVRQNGDAMILKKYQERYGKELYKSIQVSQQEIDEAYTKVSREVLTGLQQMKKNITKVHKAQLPRKKDTVVVSEPGVNVWRVWRPIEKVGLYIPGGKAIYPSSVLMSAIPAQIAGCTEIVLCTPPGKEGKIPAATLVAADMLGLKNIFKVGGAEAVAAMAYGTKSIPATYKIFGAGNSYVTAAKMIALETIAIDMPAGPSEVFVIADQTANPAWIAADLLADGEHGGDSACVLLTTSKKIAEQTIAELAKQQIDLVTADRTRESLKNYGLIALVENMDEALAFTNEYAPEHLEVMTKDADRLVSKITNAGSVFLGNYSSKSSGDYATGANHVLPTGGMAKMYPPLGVDCYGKWMQVQKCTEKGLAKIKNAIEAVAAVEELPAHRNATTIRFKS